MRSTLQSSVRIFQAKETRAPPPPNAGEVAATKPSVVIPTVVATVTKDTVVPIVEAPAVSGAAVKLKLAPSKSNIIIPTVTEWTSRIPKGLAAVHCMHTISFHTTTANITKVLYTALATTCQTLPDTHHNPTELVIQTSTADSTHRCIYVRHKNIRDLIANLVLDCHKAQTLVLTSSIELGENPTYDVESDIYLKEPT